MRFSRWTAAALVLFPLLFTGRALVTGGVYGPVDLAYTSEPLASIAAVHGIGPVTNPSISDVYAQFMPWHDALRRSIADRQWPLWNPYELCGQPLAGSAQSSPYHPFTLVALLVPVRVSFAMTATLMLFSAALFAFLLFRQFVHTDAAALFGAFGWMASTHLLFFAGTALVLASSATPLVLLGARRVAREPSRKSVVILASGLLLVVLAGHPESTLHIVTFGVAYFFFEAWCSGALQRAGVYVAGLSAGVITLLLCAVFLLPLFEVFPQSEEYVHREQIYRQPVSTAEQIGHKLEANFFPFLEGAGGVEERRHTPATSHGWLPTAYAGAMLFAPAVLGFMTTRSRERWFFVAAVFWGFAAGFSVPGFAHVLARLPGFSIAVNDRMIAFATIGMCALAAIGVEHTSERLGRAFAIVAIVTLVVAIVVPTGILGNYLRINAARAILPVALAACACFVVPRRALGLALLALLFLQRGGETTRLQPTLPGDAFYPPFPGLGVMQSREPFRIVATGTMLTPGIATHYGLEDVRGFEALTSFRYWKTYPRWCVGQPVWSNRVDRLDSPMLSLMNVRFAIVDPRAALPPWWSVRAAFPAYAIAENTRVLPRAFVPRTIRAVSSAEESVAAMSAIQDFAAEGVVEGRTATSGINGPGSVSVDGRTLRAHMDGPGWVIVSNTNWRGWRVMEHGRRIPIRYGNHAFIAFYLAAGDHTVDLRYMPRSFVIGAWISGVTLVLLLVYTAIPSSAITFFMSFHTSFFADGVRRRYAG
ncbi:MAG TPA: YfhO family protein [Thermoanaerobaculia bacterium]|nr:YfhO family protein [Thermoanaerobaculia bacterium]